MPTGPWMICPSCDGDEDGCCVCDHSGKVRMAVLGMHAREQGTDIPTVIAAIKEAAEWDRYTKERDGY